MRSPSRLRSKEWLFSSLALEPIALLVTGCVMRLSASFIERPTLRLEGSANGYRN